MADLTEYNNQIVEFYWRLPGDEQQARGIVKDEIPYTISITGNQPYVELFPLKVVLSGVERIPLKDWTNLETVVQAAAVEGKEEVNISLKILKRT